MLLLHVAISYDTSLPRQRSNFHVLPADRLLVMPVLQLHAIVDQRKQVYTCVF